MSLLKIQNMSVNLGGKSVVKDVSFDAKAGEVVAILGPNGAGKTTLLRAMLGLIPTVGGGVNVGGADFLALPAGERATIMSYLPQSHQVFWPLLVEHLVGLGRLPFDKPVGDADAVERALSMVDGLSFKGRGINSLSGGERARVLLARALAVEAPILLADEPVASLDPRHQLEVMNVFKTLAGEGNIIITVLHDLGLAARYADKICLLDEGKLVAFGKTKDIVDSDILERTFGVRLKAKKGEEALVVWEANS